MKVFLHFILVFSISLFIFLTLRSVILKLLKKSNNFETIYRILKIPSIFWSIALSLYLSIYLSADKNIKHIALIEKLISAILILSITLAISEVLVKFVDYQLRKTSFTLPPTGLIFGLIRAIVIILGLITVLSIFGFPVMHLITTLGIGGLAISLALQGTLSNFFSGLNLIASRKISKGDYIRLEDGNEGFVEDITWMNVVVKRLDNNLVIVPNNKFVNSIIINYSKPQTHLFINVPIGVSYSVDLDKVERITIEVARYIQENIEGADKDFIPFIRFTSFGDYSINFIVVLKVVDINYQTLVRHEFIRALKKKYDVENIEIPFPTRSIYLKDASVKNTV
ncbi:MAG: mechanosensitive ion channel family protein [candidate division WOR-3 bacterium]|nr:mechanosensitive ion channel family protein [candidate division WOR-3 bacterium]MDW8150937.1 mechanosensitive ion channel family protein [candidate division WOR-3 bacterium]